jgi:hypothetical protein
MEGNMANMTAVPYKPFTIQYPKVPFDATLPVIPTVIKGTTGRTREDSELNDRGPYLNLITSLLSS